MSQQGLIVKEQGGARMAVKSGGALDVESGGELDIESGGALKLAGTQITATAAELNELSGRNTVFSLLASATLAEINAGKVLLAGASGITLTVLDVKAVVDGSFAACTSVGLQDTEASPVSIASLAVAALTDGAVLNEASSNVTMGAGYLGALTEGEGIEVVNVGDPATTGTGITFRILLSVG